MKRWHVSTRWRGFVALDFHGFSWIFMDFQWSCKMFQYLRLLGSNTCSTHRLRDVSSHFCSPKLMHFCGWRFVRGASAKLQIWTGWWFGTFFIFPYIGNFIIPTDELIFFRGVGQPPTSEACQDQKIQSNLSQLTSNLDDIALKVDRDCRVKVSVRKTGSKWWGKLGYIHWMAFFNGDDINNPLELGWYQNWSTSLLGWGVFGLSQFVWCQPPTHRPSSNHRYLLLSKEV